MQVLAKTSRRSPKEGEIATTCRPKYLRIIKSSFDIINENIGFTTYLFLDFAYNGIEDR